MKKHICLIYTGGTVGMVNSERGYVPDNARFLAELKEIPDLKVPEAPDYEVIVFDPLLDSSDIAVHEWNKIGRAIAQRYDACDGFVVLHGTDTMAYSASALSFMLEGLDKPVIFTGAQIPLYEMRSDARDNIVTAMMIAAEGREREVCLYFGGKLLRGCRATKSSSDALEAFESPNAPLLAEAGIRIRYLEQASPALSVENGAAYGRTDNAPREGLRLQELANIPIGVIKVFPGIQFEFFEQVMTDKLRGVVLETFGTGHVPSSQKALLHIIAKAHESGSVIVARSQCAQGEVRLGTYAASSALVDIGAVNGGDMTTEAALTKLYYLFSKGLEVDEIKRLMETNLRGELTE